MRLWGWVRYNLVGILAGASVILMLVVLFRLGGLVDRAHDSDLESCARNNDARLANVRDKRGDAKVMETQLTLWEAALHASPPEQQKASPPEVLEAFEENMDQLRKGIQRKRRLIHDSITAQADVAIHPGSPIADCSRAFP